MSVPLKIWNAATVTLPNLFHSPYWVLTLLTIHTQLLAVAEWPSGISAMPSGPVLQVKNRQPERWLEKISQIKTLKKSGRFLHGVQGQSLWSGGQGLPEAESFWAFGFKRRWQICQKKFLYFANCFCKSPLVQKNRFAQWVGCDPLRQVIQRNFVATALTDWHEIWHGDW